MPETHWYFKLFNSIKEEHEVDFVELELQVSTLRQVIYGMSLYWYEGLRTSENFWF